MKKLLILVVCCFLSVPSSGVDWIKDRIYTSLSYSRLGVNYDVGFHYTNSTKISVGYVIKPIINSVIKPTLDEEFGGVMGLMAKLHYHHQFESTDITPYITFGTGGIIAMSQKQEGFFSYQIGSGINLPLSERTNVFAGYKLHKFSEFSHGFELGMSFNL
ncbi:P44/Msp2 family outer membrane protein [Wolbachia endosymbiont (group B) of Carcina quercana]|uniref:P44/Msp2 family outer membrane protein n=1 Tax=Wolbachia endosymbiont (group B) of Carcina quercana TaxID=2953992 RepID=UPI002220247B|nr:P44/Msp2 family outer membrane protein [Wolbachia endosymbiont (group B) of Carcina quercana]